MRPHAPLPSLLRAGSGVSGGWIADLRRETSDDKVAPTADSFGFLPAGNRWSAPQSNSEHPRSHHGQDGGDNRASNMLRHSRANMVAEDDARNRTDQEQPDQRPV